MKNILFVASEGVPFIKTGGLADVVGSLPKEIDKKYYDVRVFLPKYSCMRQEMKDKLEYITSFYMDFDWRSMYVGIMTAVVDDVRYYFIDNEDMFNTPRPYTDDPLFEIKRFAFFSKAVLSALPTIGFRPDLIHCHDWQTGLVPVYLKERFQNNDFYHGIKTVMTIHNLRFQGKWNVKDVENITGLSGYYFTPDKLEAYKDANLLKGGLVYADAITTVSPTYAEEIKSKYYGEGLDGLLNARSHDLRGILNGIDYSVFDPAKDKRIPHPYSKSNWRKEKIKNKIELQKELGLAQDEKTFMIGIVSRLTDQKGFDLIAYVMEEMLSLDAIQVVVLGTGEERYENMFRYFAEKYGNKLSANIYYSEDLSHKIYAASDAFLMPSLFEPCGLSQLMALRYGSVPIVRETGGLKDTVQPYDEYAQTGTGFTFTNYNAHEMMHAVRYAEKIYYDRKKDWNHIVDRGMAADFSWKKSAGEYQLMYDWLIG
ncbi:MAG: glycogen synthase GlgA [Lachnospiraceae bacterium]|nr:glycogen synthase GlgA [Lachnospiraceae bacterium]